MKNLEYNSGREKLIIPEYGRNVQKLLNYARTIEDKDQRQLFVEMVVKLMEQIQSSTKPSKELTDKLWNHAFIIGQYQLDVRPPEDVEIVPQEARQHPPKLDYPHHETRYKHYGFNVQTLIQKAIAMEDEQKRKEMSVAIASYMKLAYRTWNRDHYINDEAVKADLLSMSDNKLDLDDSVALDFLTHEPPRRPKRSSGKKGRSKGGRHRKKR
jgi:hypothetical protein